MKKNAQTGMKKLWIVLSCVAVALLVITVAAAVVVDSFLNRIGRFDGDEATYSPEQLESMLATGGDETVDATFPGIPADLIIPDENVVNILLVGQDRREGQPRSHSDATIMCTINKKTKTLTMTSFMRDMWVEIPGYYPQRINTTYMINGFELLNDTLEHNFGIRSDHNIEVDFSGFMNAIDLVGGIDIELTEKEAKYLNRRGNWEVEDNAYTWNLKEGVNHLNGSQACAYSRIRDIGDDFERTSRQRTVLMEMVEQAKNLNVIELYELVKEIAPLLTTDMTNSEILGYAVAFAPILSELEIVSQRIPMDGHYSFAEIDGNYVIVLSEKNYEASRKLLADTVTAEASTDQ